MHLMGFETRRDGPDKNGLWTNAQVGTVEAA